MEIVAVNKVFLLLLVKKNLLNQLCGDCAALLIPTTPVTSATDVRNNCKGYFSHTQYNEMWTHYGFIDSEEYLQ